MNKLNSNVPEYCTLSELVKYITEDSGCTIEETMERACNSQLLPALQNEDGETLCSKSCIMN